MRRDDVLVPPSLPTGETFARLIEPHLAALLACAAALVGPADAEDAAQEAILRAWQAWGSVYDLSGLRGWLLRITINVCRDWRRGRFGTVRARTQSLDASGEASLAWFATDPGTSDITGALDLRAAVNRLDEETRVIILLRFYVGLDSSEIGAGLGLPAATVRTRLRRGLQRLRTLLATERATSAPSSPNSTTPSAPPAPPERSLH